MNLKIHITDIQNICLILQDILPVMHRYEKMIGTSMSMQSEGLQLIFAISDPIKNYILHTVLTHWAY